MINIGDVVKLIYPNYYVILKVNRIKPYAQPYYEKRDLLSIGNSRLEGKIYKVSNRKLEKLLNENFGFYTYRDYKVLNRDELIMELL